MHTCFSSLLARTLRISPGETVVFFDFLAPAVRCQSRCFTSNPKSQTWTSPSPMRRARQRPDRDVSRKYKSRIPRPPRESADEVAAWIGQLERFVPFLLHKSTSAHPVDEASTVPINDIARFLIYAHEEEHIDLLTQVCTKGQHWHTIPRLIKRLLKDLPADSSTIPQYDPLENVEWPLYSLDKATGLHLKRKTGGLWANIRQPGQEVESLDSFTESGFVEEDDDDIRLKFMGLLWRSLGQWILLAGEEKADPKIMITVRQILADLHHMDLIPEQVYNSHEKEHQNGLTQPPLLHLFSSRILSSLSNATWESHDPDVHDAMNTGQPTYFFGVALPGTRYKAKVEGLSAGIWLELVLWSCVHGGWIREATDIVIQATSINKAQRWSIARWQTILDSAQESSELIDGSSPDDNKRKANLCAGRTISSEVVSNLAQNLVDSIECDPSSKNHTVESVTRLVQTLKRALNHDDESVGDMSWSATIVRILESDEKLIERNPRAALDVAGLGPTLEDYSHLDLQFSHVEMDDFSRSLLKPSAVAQGVYHGAIRRFATLGHSAWAIKGFSHLVRCMDINKKITLETFSRSLQDPNFTKPDFVESIFASITPDPLVTRYEYIPHYVTEATLDSATQVGYLDVGKWLLFSTDVDGTVIRKRAYASRRLAAAIIRFGAASHDRTLLEDLLLYQSVVWGNGRKPLSRAVLNSLLVSQVAYHRWGSVRNILQTLGKSYSAGNPEFMAAMVSELIRQGISKEQERPSNELRDILLNYCLGTFGAIDKASKHRGNVILALLVTVNSRWASLANSLWGSTTAQESLPDIKCFNSILEATVQSCGIVKGQEIVHKWCIGIDETWSTRLSHPLPDKPFQEDLDSIASSVPPKLPVYLEEYKLPVPRFRNRWKPNVQTIRILWRAVHGATNQLPRNSVGLTKDQSNVLEWCQKGLHKLGYSSDLLRMEMHMDLDPGDARD